MSAPTPTPARLTRRDLLLAAALLALVAVAFAGVRHADFVDYDDPDYVITNPHVAAGLTAAGVRWAFTTETTGYWHPLTWLTLMLDRSVYGPGPLGYHLTNLLWHAAATLLVFALLRALTGAVWRSALVAAVWAVHPLRVESVAWVAERKDGLCATLALLTCWVYVRYVRRPGAGRYALVLLAFALALLAKPMAVTVPAVLLLLDFWPLNRLTRDWRTWWRCALEKTPLLALAVADAVVTFYMQWHTGAMAPLGQLSFAARVGNALVAYCRYLGKLVWPSDLVVLYPLPPGGWPTGAVVAAGVLLVTLTLLAWWQRTRRPWLLLGWLWYGGVALPVIGLIQVGQQALADRYTYLPTLGLLIALGWSVPAAWGVGRARLVTGAAVAVLLAVLVLATRQQVRHWQTSEALFTHTLAHSPANPSAHTGLAAVLLAQHRLDEAAVQCTQALMLNPLSARAHATLATVRLRQGRFAEAQQEAAAALTIDPVNQGARLTLAAVFAAQGQLAAALALDELVLQAEPTRVEAHLDLAQLLLTLDRLADAEPHLLAALAVEPDNATANNRLGVLRARQGRNDEARACFARAVARDPALTEAQLNYGVALAQAGQYAAAVAPLETTVQRQPASFEAHLALAMTRLALGAPTAAAVHAHAALRLRPDSAAAASLWAATQRAAAVPGTATAP